MSEPNTPRPAGGRGLVAILAACGLCAPLTLASEGMIKKAYRDPVGILTACAGHTGQGVVAGEAYTDAQCQAFERQDLVGHGEAIAACIKVDIPLKSRAAFTDFAFNVGSGAFCRSSMARLVNGGHLAQACAQLSLWTKAGGQVLPGLVRRRAAERALCEAGLQGR